MKLVSYLGTCGVFFLAVAGSVALGQQALDIEPLSTACHTTLTTSAPNYLRVCITSNGNLIYFESPQGQKHISHEGYLIEGWIYDPSMFGMFSWNAGDFGVAAWNFVGTSTVTQPNGKNTLPLTITRKADLNYVGQFELKQTFERDSAEREVVITMTIKRLTNPTSGLQARDVCLYRYFDGDINGSSNGDHYARTNDSVFGWDTHGLMLTGLTPGVTGAEISAPSTNIGYDYSPNDEGVGNVSYCVNSSAKGASKTFKVSYRRF